MKTSYSLLTFLKTPSLLFAMLYTLPTSKMR